MPQLSAASGVDVVFLWRRVKLFRVHRAILAVLVGCTGLQASYGQTVWTAGADNWFTPANWTLGVPNAASGTAFDAIIANGGTAQISAPGGSVRRLRVGLVGGPGNLTIDGGTLNVTDDLHLNEGSAGSASVTVQGGSIATAVDTVVGFSSAASTSFLISGPGTVYNATNDFTVGRSGAGTASLNIEGGAVLASATSTLGTFAASKGTATVTGAGSRWSSTGAFTVGNAGMGTLTIADEATVHVGTTLSIGSTSSVNLNGGTLRFDVAGSSVNRINYSSGTIQIAGNRNVVRDAAIVSLFGASLAPPAAINIPAGKQLSVEGTATISGAAWPVTVNGGGLTSANIVFGQATVNNFGVPIRDTGTFIVNNGAAITTTSNASVGTDLLSAGVVNISGAGTSWTIGGNALVGGLGSGSLTISDGALVYVGNELAISNGSLVDLQEGILRFNTVSGLSGVSYSGGTIQLAGNRGVGADPTITTLYGARPTIPTGKGLSVEGAATLSKPLLITGGKFKTTSLHVAPGGDLIFDRGVIEIAGGNVTGLANLVIPNNGEYRARGVQMTRITGAVGSTIKATADLALGDPSHPSGFYSNGALDVGANVVTFQDANDAVLDSAALVTLGAGGNPGTLAAANGLTLDFGGNVVGFGTIATPNNIAKPLINNGHITGDSAEAPLTLSGYVKGVGTLDNVNLTGTYSPGLSPTIVQASNLSLAPTSALVMELGGSTPGSGYDQLQITGTLALEGTLVVSLINGFVPTGGQTFELFSGGSISGAFSAVQLPIVSGLSWNTSQLAAGIVSVVSAGLPGDYNNNGVVDAADYTTYRDALGTNVTLPNDSSPGVVTTADYAVWQANFGQGGPSAAAAVPEPTALFLVLVGGPMMVGVAIRQSSSRLHFR